MTKSNAPLYDWLPRPVGIAVYLFMFIPILFTNGVYMNTMTEMFSALGLHSEDMQLANFVTFVGNAAFAPLMVAYLDRRRTKTVYVFGFAAMLLLTAICAHTHSVPILVGSCFFIGFFRVMLVLNTTFGVMPYITGKDMTQTFFGGNEDVNSPEQAKTDRFRMVALPIYFFVLILVSQLGNAIASTCAFHFGWQSVHRVMMLFTLTALLLVLITVEREPKQPEQRIKFNKLPEMLLFIASMVALCYLLIYGKILDWFDSKSIRMALAVVISCGGLLLVFITKKSNPYLNLAIFRYPNVRFAAILLFLTMILNSSTVLITTYSSISMTLDNLQMGHLNNLMIGGFFIGTIIALIIIRKKLKIKLIFVLGFILFTASAMLLYFRYQSEDVYGWLAIPILLRSAGMVMLYSVGSVYGMMKLPSRLRPSWICLMLICRSVLGPTVGITLYSNAIYEQQNFFSSRFAEKADALNPEATLVFQRTQAVAKMQGASYENAASLATASLNGRIQKQAALAALKQVTGWTIWVGIGCVVFVVVFPFRFVKFVKNNFLRQT
jgi:MFS family permease